MAEPIPARADPPPAEDALVPAQALVASSAPAGPAASQTRIALVDDDAELVAALTTLLIHEGYAVIGCSDPEDAYAQIVERPPDLLLLDLQLAEPHGGIQLLRRLQLNPRTASLPILICSGDEFWIRRLEALVTPPQYACLRKPFLIDDLLDRIERLLGRPLS